ncbi:MAG: ShlB/FhaC/HecB family hemolysin secretion/activation protein [Cyanobacteria bacterium J06606_4]
MHLGFEQLARSLAVLGILSGSIAATIQPGIAADLLASEALTLQASEPSEPNALERSSEGLFFQARSHEFTPLHFTPAYPEPSPSTGAPTFARRPAFARRPTSFQRPYVDEPQAPRLSQNAPASELGEPDPELTPLPEASPVLPEQAPPEPTQELPVNGAQVDISEIRVVGNTVFSEADLAPILSEYEGRSLGISELRRVADEITQRYLEAGYITSRAVLSEQTIVGGVLEIRVVEGTLEDIQIEGTRRLANYVRDRVNLANRRPLNQVDLESQLQLLRADPLIERIEASLRAGTGEGQSLLVVRVLEAPAFSGRAVFDTNSPPSVGVARMGLEANYNNALGLGDQLSLSAYRSTTGGSNTYGVTYRVPVNALNGTLQARYLPSTFELIEPELAALDVEGSSSTYEFTFRQPLIRKPNEEFALSLGFRRRTGETLISDVVIDSTRTSVFQFGQDYLRRDRTGAWGLRSQFNLGTDLFEATDRDGEADGQFFSWLGQIQRAQVINRDNLLLMQGSLQLSADSLLGADQFIVGGPSSVRGYSQNARFGDNGFRASVENRTTVLRNEDGSPFAQIAPFVDTAAVWNQRDNTSDQNFLLGTGIGLILNPFEEVQARFDVGIPLVELNEPGDSPQDAFIYFSMDYRF